MLCAVCLTLSFMACDDVLDTENYTKQNTSNFPATSTDMANELAALYGVMGQIQNAPLQTPYFIDEIMSDNCFGGGGDGDNEPKAIEHFTLYTSSMYDKFWKLSYAGISRANSIIATVDNVAWNGDTESRNQALGEAYFMRAFYYLWLSQHFGDIPLVVTTTVPNPCPDASAENEIYPQILSDLVSASNLMNQKIDGHANKYAAEALLARAYLFYEGFYKNAGEMAKATPEAITLVSQEGVSEGQTLSKSNVTDGLKDVIDNGGYKLLKDYRSLWQYSNRITQQDYDYTKDIPSDDVFKNGNDEELFQVRFSNASTYAGSPQATYTLAYSNNVSLFCGLRCDADAAGDVNGEANTFPFGQGWGQAPVSGKLWSDWTQQEEADGQTDARKAASIIDCQKDLEKYAFTSTCTEDAGYADKKYCSVTALRSLDGTKTQNWNGTDDYTWWCFEAAWTSKSGANSKQENHFEDFYLIRYADVLLMQTELTGDATYMNEVRKRAGLSEKTYSWDNIQNERRWELAFEGLRWNDLRRWSGISANATSLIGKTLDAQGGQRINVKGSWTTLKHMNSSWSQRYVETKGFLPKPQSQISLANGAMKQNEGWSGSSAAYTQLY